MYSVIENIYSLMVEIFAESTGLFLLEGKKRIDVDEKRLPENGKINKHNFIPSIKYSTTRIVKERKER